MRTFWKSALVALLVLVAGAGAVAAQTATLTGISPTFGPISGGTAATLIGSDFVAGNTSVTIGGNLIPAAFVTVNSATSLTFTAPAHAAGNVAVNVTTPSGTSNDVAGGFTYENSPTTNSLSPASGSIAGGTSVTVTGTDFVAGDTSVTIGGTFVSPTVNSATSLTFTTPAHANGNVAVSVSTSGGTSNNVPGGFTYQTLAPTLSGVSPGTGSVAGGTSITLSGTNLTGITSVTVGGIAANNVNVVNNNNVTATVPAYISGSLTKDVMASDGVTNATLSAAFTYQPVSPTLTNLSPSTGSTAGGTTITITGTGFTPSTTVTIGGLSAIPVNVANSTTLTAVTPTYISGSLVKNVVVNNGVGSATLTGGFTYQAAAPTVSGISPTTGTAAGGTAVTVTGTGFTPATTLTIGGNAASSVNVIDSNTLSAVTPAYLSGSLAADVVVDNGAGSATLAAAFTYTASSPTLTMISPNTGGIAGGTSVTVTGTGFTPSTTLSIGGIAATSVVVANSTTLTATTPAYVSGSLVKDVVVNNGVGSATLVGGFTYSGSAPTISGISPNTGSTAGGTTVTVTGTAFTPATTLSIAGVAANSVTFVNSTTLTALTPAYVSGSLAADVVVDNGVANATLTNGFTYQVAAPTLATLSPGNGPVAGGTTITVTGTGFTPGTTLAVGGIAATSMNVVNSTTLTAVVPAYVSGSLTKDVAVNNGTGSATLTNGFAYVASAPTLTAISPNNGSVAGGTSVTATGTGFTPGTTLALGGVAATSVVVINSTTLTAITSAHAPGIVNVTVDNGIGNATLNNGFAYQSAGAPTLTGISPATGSTAGGTLISLTGSTLIGMTSVTVGGIAATNVTVVNNSTVTAIVPAYVSGSLAKDVIVGNASTNAALVAAFTYQASAPTLTGISPSTGPVGGGTSVTVTGTGFVPGTVLSIGGATASSVVVVNSTTLTAVTAAHAQGIVDVVVNNGVSTATLTNGFTYGTAGPPTVTGINPATGPVAGGTSVTISGANFTVATSVTIGGIAATSVAFVNSTTVTASTPAYVSGSLTKDVVVNNGISSATLTNGFTYVAAAPTLAGISPGSGPVAGGTSVTITGTGFTPSTTFTVGGIAATSVVITNSTTATAVTPAYVSGSLVKDVAVSNGIGSATLANGFTYQSSAPTLTAISPNSGSATGGTSVTISGSNFTGTSAVTFGGVAATSFVVSGPNAITAVTPAHAMGSVDVSVVAPAGSITKSAAFTYTIPSDSAKLRALQIMATAMAAQASGASITGAVDDAIADGFGNGSGGPVAMTSGGLRFNFSADADDGDRGSNAAGQRDRYTALSSGNAFAGDAKRPDQSGTAGSRIDDAFASLDRGLSTKAAPFRPMKEWLGWAEIRGSVINRWSNSNFAGTASEAALYGNQVNALIGLTRRLTPDFLVGAFGGYETFDYRSESMQGRLKGDGWTVGAYLGWKLASSVRLDAAVAWSGIGYDGTAGTATGSFTGKRLLVSGGLVGDYKAWAVAIEPSAKVYALWERENAYTDSLGTLQAARNFSAGRASAGAKMVYPLALESGITLAPYAGAYSDYYFNADDAAAAGLAGIAASPILSGWSARAIGGLASRWSNGAQLEAGAELGGLGSTSHTRIWTYRAKGSVPF